LLEPKSKQSSGKIIAPKPGKNAEHGLMRGDVPRIFR